ncbi:MAG: glycosyltransferase family 2 protein [Candidatus Falkowbacteria bacterium]
MVKEVFKKVSVIIPAFNEEKTVAWVVKAALSHPAVGEVIVIDDGSTDNTAAWALLAGAKVYRLTENMGKGAAMREGVSRARHEFICFLDADIRGLNRDTLDNIIRPVLSGRYRMYIAIRDRRIEALNRIMRFFPLLGGERAITRELWGQVPERYKKDFQIEIALNYFAKKNGYAMGFCLMPNLTQVTKEKKRGLSLGLR